MKRPVWKLLSAFFAACALASLVAWGVLLTGFCSNPRTPEPQTQHVIAYSCHGMTVFISHRADALRYWLIPLGLVFVFLSLIAAVMVFVKVRIGVRIHREGECD